MNNILDQRLEYRQGKIQITKDYLAQTKHLLDLFGSSELKTSQGRFDQLENALNSNQVRLVVIGEFSRGKSSLVNALLGIHLLRCAQEATTAINTFVRALPADRKDRFILIHYQDSRPVQEVPWDDEAALERWSTELDKDNADKRKTVDYIEIFTDHPLLQKNLVLIDTPGLQSVVKHHEQITRKAIAEAHIALWVQSTSQLGGNATEWAFLSDTIRRNFRKFITVVNMWDAVLDPCDSQEKLKPEAVRVSEKLEKVKNNFREHLKSQPAAEIELLTSSDNLMGVSALWSLGDDLEKKKRSGVDRLAGRIAEMLTSGEAMEQIFLKPLQQLSSIQVQLAEGIEDEQRQLASSKTLEERQRELEIFEKDIKILEEESKRVTMESRLEHDNAARSFVDKVRQTLVAPLAELKADIENQVDVKYVEKMIKKGVKQIGLPEELHQEFQSITAKVEKEWEQKKQGLAETLEGLRAEYAKQMQKHAGNLKIQVSKLNVQISDLDVHFDLDFSSIEDHHQKVLALKQTIAARKDEINGIETDLAKNSASSMQLELARQAVNHAQRSINQLGMQPVPLTRSERTKVKEGGMYSSDKYALVDRADYSNVEVWKENLAKQQSLLSDKNLCLEKIVADEERKTGVRMSIEKAQKKYEREISEYQKEKAKLERTLEKEQSDLAQDSARRLVSRTAGQLDQRIRYLQDNAAEAIRQLFSEQLDLLNACVQEQYLEPINAKRARREEIQALLQQGQAEISQRQSKLAVAKQELADLQLLTQAALKA